MCSDLSHNIIADIADLTHLYSHGFYNLRICILVNKVDLLCIHLDVNINSWYAMNVELCSGRRHWLMNVAMICPM